MVFSQFWFSAPLHSLHSVLLHSTLLWFAPFSSSENIHLLADGSTYTEPKTLQKSQKRPHFESSSKNIHLLADGSTYADAKK